MKGEKMYIRLFTKSKFFLLFVFAGLCACSSTPVSTKPPEPTAHFTIFYDTDGLASSSITDLAVDYARNGLWAASWNGISFYSFKDSSFTTYGITSDLPSIKVNTLAINRGVVWAGTTAGVSTFSQNIWESLPDMNVLADTYINSIVSLSDNSLWFSTRGGASRLSAGGLWSSYTITDGLSDNTITSIAMGADGKVWVGTNNGINIFDGTGWTIFNTGLPNNEIHALYRDSQGTMWVGTANGIASFQNNSIVSYDISSGLPSNNIFQFSEDYSHVMWVATDNGTAFFTGTGWSQFQLPAAVNGLPVYTLKSDSKTLSLWFGTSLGLVRYQVN
jgi:ligand-binding sensor domain-containing protein